MFFWVIRHIVTLKTKTIPSMQSIAKRAGVSCQTVSLALRNHPKISVETRTRIQKLADQLGYCPDPFVSSLMARIQSGKPVKQLGTLAFINSFTPSDNRRHSSIYTEFFEGAAERSRQCGYRPNHPGAFLESDRTQRIWRQPVPRLAIQR